MSLYLHNFSLSLCVHTAHELLQPSVCKDLPGRAKLPQASHQYWWEERATPKENRGDNSWNRRIAYLYTFYFFYTTVYNVYNKQRKAEFSISYEA